MTLPKPWPGLLCIAAIATLSLACSTHGRLQAYRDSHGQVQDFLAHRGLDPFPATAPSIYYDGQQWFERAMELIAAAEDYILVNSFLVTDHPRARQVFAALAARQAEGLRVYCTVDSASYYRTYPQDPTPIRAIIKDVLELGLPIVEYNPIRGARIPTLAGLLDRDHRKFWVIDGHTIVVGGQNIDFDSLRFPDERGSIDGMVEVYSPEGARFLRDSFISTWNAYSALSLRTAACPISLTICCCNRAAEARYNDDTQTRRPL